MAGMLIDSDVLVWVTRGHVAAARRLHALNPWRIWAVTDIELAQGLSRVGVIRPPGVGIFRPLGVAP
jgi:hypothetical protein